MKIEKGMAVNVEGMSDIVRQAVVKKFEELGFSLQNDFRYKFIGVDIDNSARSFSELGYYGCNAKEITLPELMLCDQPDEVTHCYFIDGELYYHKTHLHNHFLICARDNDFIKGCVAFSPKDFGAIPEPKSWYEKGELPPVGEVVEYPHSQLSWYKGKVVGYDKGFNDIDLVVLSLLRFKVPECNDFKNYIAFRKKVVRPIQSERDKLIEAAQAVSGLRARDGAREVAQNFVDAGWRPTDESSR